MGFASHMCVTATALSAFELGFENFILNDCCATRDLPLFDGVVKSRNLHKASLALLGDRYATIIQSSSSLT